MTQLNEDEVQLMVDEMASDPDDVHLPASVRNSYRCNKQSTGELNRDSLIKHINDEGRCAAHSIDFKSRLQKFIV